MIYNAKMRIVDLMLLDGRMLYLNLEFDVFRDQIDRVQ